MASKYLTGRGREITSLDEMRTYASRLEAQVESQRQRPESERVRPLHQTRNLASDAALAVEEWEAAEAAGRSYSGGEG